MDTNFSTLSLAPQELVSYILDFDAKLLYLKQKNSCKFYDLIYVNTSAPEKDQEKQKHIHLPNIAELFELFPYVMFFNRTVEIDGNMMHEFKYSFPLGEQGNQPSDSQFLVYFHPGSMDLDRIVVQANSLNITRPFALYASQPVTPTKFKKKDMEFRDVKCKKATKEE